MECMELANIIGRWKTKDSVGV